MRFVLAIVFAAIIGTLSATIVADQTARVKVQCPWIVGKDNVKGFPVLPGSGWDNLRNREMGPVADVSLAGDCTLSVDGLYALPDQVIAYPIKESQVTVVSNVIEHYDNYSSSTSRSVNAGGGGGFFGGLFGIGGKYSNEFQEVKKTAIYSKTQLGRTQLRYNLYVARLVPDYRFSRVFKNRLLSIGKAVEQNLTRETRYLSDLLVRDFGTHVITSLDAGAVLEKLDYFKLDSLSKSVYTTNKISQCMSVSFFAIFSAGESSTLVVTNEELHGYMTSVQKTTVNAHGGPTVGAKINLTNWKNRLRQNLVATDRLGDLLFTTVSRRSLPELTASKVKAVRDAVKDAVSRYYKMNTIKGCLNQESPNFEPLANIEGPCDSPLTNFSFGGVFQTCSGTEPGLCGQGHSPMQVNYLTGGYSCPDGYEPVPLLSFVGFHLTRWFVFKEIKTVVNAYWCAANRDRQLPSQSGALYGGVFSPRLDNANVGGKACPNGGYRPYRIGRDISVCISSDMTESARLARIRFGGFFTCNSGNPLAESGRRIVTSLKSKSGPPPPPPPLPPPPPPIKRCPDGFTQSALEVFDGCEIMHCVKTMSGRNSERKAMSRRPPYEEVPDTVDWRSQLRSVHDDKPSVSNATGGSAATTTLAICAIVGVAVAFATATGYAVFKKKQKQRQQQQQPTVISGSQHQIVESTEEADCRQPLLG